MAMVSIWWMVGFEAIAENSVTYPLRFLIPVLEIKNLKRKGSFQSRDLSRLSAGVII